jgi:hypothetical protein
LSLYGPSRPNEPMRSSILMPLGVDAPQYLGRFILGQTLWRVCMPKTSTCPTYVSKQPQVPSLWGRGQRYSHPSRWRPYILPHLKSLSSSSTSTSSTISKSLLELVPPLQLSLLETSSFVPTRNPKFLHSGNLKFPQTKLYNTHLYTICFLSQCGHFTQLQRWKSPNSTTLSRCDVAALLLFGSIATIAAYYNWLLPTSLQFFF